MATVTSKPVFITTLPTIESGSWVLSTYSPTNSSGFSYENTNVSYMNIYSTVPNIGLGLDFLNSLYSLTNIATDTMIDLSVVQKLQTYALIQLNRSMNSVQQISVNYVVSDSSFFLDTRITTQIDLTAYTVYTSASSSSRTVVI